MQSFLVALCMAILEKLITRGTQEWVKYEALRDELARNKQKADEYQKVVDGNKSREERRSAEDELMGG